MAFKQRQYKTTKNMLKQLIYHVYSFNTFSLSEEIKDKSIAIIQKQIIKKNYYSMMGVLQNFNINLKRLLWNGFGEF